jgi:lipopolysaccharide biosynthesis protein
MNIPRTIAFYLPQYHPTPENNLWWGEGFTEWTNVAKAKPLFSGHNQPFLPSDLGYYDLRCAETRQQQANLALEHGVTAFCYWHYWFAGRRILERPFQEVLESKSPDFPFCLGWANQTWSGTWHGAPDKILIEQTYPGPSDDTAHFQYLYSAFIDSRYLKVDGRPVLYIFRPEDLPNPVAWSKSINDYMKSRGLNGVFLIGEISDLLGNSPKAGNADKYGFDAMVYMRLPAKTDSINILRMRLRRKLLRQPERHSIADDLFRYPPSIIPHTTYPCVYTNWDNTPRSGVRGLVLEGASPGTYERHLSQAFALASADHPSNPLVFVKSWNEWAEGNVLEPSAKFGSGFLESHKRVTQKFAK